MSAAASTAPRESSGARWLLLVAVLAATFPFAVAMEAVPVYAVVLFLFIAFRVWMWASKPETDAPSSPRPAVPPRPEPARATVASPAPVSEISPEAARRAAIVYERAEALANELLSWLMAVTRHGPSWKPPEDDDDFDVSSRYEGPIDLVFATALECGLAVAMLVEDARDRAWHVGPVPVALAVLLAAREQRPPPGAHAWLKKRPEELPVAAYALIASLVWRTSSSTAALSFDTRPVKPGTVVDWSKKPAVVELLHDHMDAPTSRLDDPLAPVEELLAPLLDPWMRPERTAKPQLAYGAVTRKLIRRCERMRGASGA